MDVDLSTDLNALFPLLASAGFPVIAIVADRHPAGRGGARVVARA